MSIFKKIKESYKKHKEALKSISDEELIDIIRENNGRITATGLARQTSLTYLQASIKLQGLYDKGYVSMSYTNNGFTQVMTLKEHVVLQSKSIGSSKLKDAEVLKATVDAGGKINPAALCMALDCSIDAARKKLDELQLKGVYDLEVTDKGSILYVLNDMGCFQDPKIKKIG